MLGKYELSPIVMAGIGVVIALIAEYAIRVFKKKLRFEYFGGYSYFLVMLVSLLVVCYWAYIVATDGSMAKRIQPALSTLVIVAILLRNSKFFISGSADAASTRPHSPRD